VGAALKKGRTVHFLTPYRAEHTVKLAALLGIAPGAVKEKRSVALHRAVAAQRLYKTPEEVKDIELAIDVSREMYAAAMKGVRPGRKEYEIVAEVARVVVQAAQVHAPPNIELELSSPPWLPHASGDSDKVAQVLANLVENGVKYSPEGGRVEVLLEHEGDRIRFAVRDPGLGIPLDEQERIFEKFYRLDPNLTRGIGGTGLGLYICRELVHRMHGRIWLVSDGRRGSTFTVELPVAA